MYISVLVWLAFGATLCSSQGLFLALHSGIISGGSGGPFEMWVTKFWKVALKANSPPISCTQSKPPTHGFVLSLQTQSTCLNVNVLQTSKNKLWNFSSINLFSLKCLA